MSKNFRELKQGDLSYILVRTTSDGPFAEDAFFLIFTENQYWEIPNSHGKEVLEWLEKFSSVNHEELIVSMGCTEDRLFLIYRGHKCPTFTVHERKQMKKRLSQFLLSHFVGNANELETIINRLFSAYSRNSRHYHNLSHIHSCLWELDQIEDPRIDKTVIELAIWYHDLVYNPLRSDNEIKSSQAMLNDLNKFKTKIDLNAVSALIYGENDQYEEIKSNKLNEKYFHDIDFAIFGQHPLEYASTAKTLNESFTRCHLPCSTLKEKLS